MPIHIFPCPGLSVLQCFSVGSLRDKFSAMRHRTLVSQRLTEAGALSHSEPTDRCFSVSQAKRFVMFFGRFAARQFFAMRHRTPVSQRLTEAGALSHAEAPYRLYSKPAYGFHVFFSCFSCFGMPVAPWAFNVFHCPGPSVLQCVSVGSLRDKFL